MTAGTYYIIYGVAHVVQIYYRLQNLNHNFSFRVNLHHHAGRNASWEDAMHHVQATHT